MTHNRSKSKRKPWHRVPFWDAIKFLPVLIEDLSDGWEERVAEEIRKIGRMQEVKEKCINEAIEDNINLIKEVRLGQSPKEDKEP